MSRIYEALERAENERKVDARPEQEAPVQTAVIPPPADGPRLRPGEVFEQIVRRPWSPVFSALPTLADSGAVVEQFRGLRSSIYQIRDQIPLKTILISSGMPADGKTFVATNLAISLARNSERPVLLIDADLRRPAVHSLLGTSESPGLGQFLTGNIAVTDMLQRPGEVPVAGEPGARALANLALIPAGQPGDHAPELAGNLRIEELIAAVSPHFSWIVIDSPPALAVTDAIDLARVSDGVLLVARGAATTFHTAQRAKAAFNNTRILGFVLNAVKRARHSESYYYYAGYTAADSSSRHSAKRG